MEGTSSRLINQTDLMSKKITWTIRKFTSLTDQPIESATFLVDRLRWKLQLFPKGKDESKGTHLSMYLLLDEAKVSYEQRTRMILKFTVVNQCFTCKSSVKERTKWFYSDSACHGVTSLCNLEAISARHNGFLVNDCLCLVAELTNGISTMHDEDSTCPIRESVLFCGFELPPTQVVDVRRLLNKYTDTVFPTRNPALKTAYLNILFVAMEILRQSDCSHEDMLEATETVRFLTNSGIRLKWLEEKLGDLRQNKKTRFDAETHLEQLKKQLQELQEKCLALESRVQKEQEKVDATKNYIVFPDEIQVSDT